jgi:hypothetical protein
MGMVFSDHVLAELATTRSRPSGLSEALTCVPKIVEVMSIAEAIIVFRILRIGIAPFDWVWKSIKIEIH